MNSCFAFFSSCFGTKLSLRKAVENNNIDAALSCIAAGEDVNQTANGRPLLFIALNKKYFKIMELLIKNNADISCIDMSATIQPFWAVFISDYFTHRLEIKPIMQLIGEKLPQVGVLYGNKLLASAVGNNDSYVAEMLLAKGASAAAKGLNDIYFPLETAINQHNFLMVKLLLKYGANANAEGFMNRTPLEYIAATYLQQVKRKAHPDYSKMRDDFLKKYNEIIKCLIAYGASIDQQKMVKVWGNEVIERIQIDFLNPLTNKKEYLYEYHHNYQNLAGKLFEVRETSLQRTPAEQICTFEFTNT